MWRIFRIILFASWGSYECQSTQRGSGALSVKDWGPSERFSPHPQGRRGSGKGRNFNADQNLRGTPSTALRSLFRWWITGLLNRRFYVDPPVHSRWKLCPHPQFLAGTSIPYPMGRVESWHLVSPVCSYLARTWNINWTALAWCLVQWELIWSIGVVPVYSLLVWLRGRLSKQKPR